MSSDWQEQELEINGARLHVARSGAATQPAVVLVHGFSDSGRCWPRLARELREAYEVVLPDARGHGLSARIAPDEEVDLAGDLAGIIVALGLARPVVAGHSMGAGTAAQLAARFPDHVRALILEDPPWRPYPESPALVGLRPGDLEGNEVGQRTQPAKPTPDAHPLKRWMNSLNGLTANQIADESRAEHPTWPQEVLQRWSEAKQQLDHNFFLRKEAHQMSWPEVVDAIQCPTLLITSDPDHGGIITPQLAQEIAERNPVFTVVRIEDVGHHIRFEAYDHYRDAVLDFLGKLERSN
jgi:N-formylmaleamate deformylase